MPANPNIPTYSAADLLRYATGRMTAPEMHALEKATLEDPFLAEALEGYMEASTTHAQLVLQEQIENLPPKAQKKEQSIIIPLWRRTAFRIAVAALFIAGAGWLVFSLVQPKQSATQNDMAIAQRQKPNTAGNNISGNMLATDSTIASKPVLADTQFSSQLNVLASQQNNQKPSSTEPENEITTNAPTLADANISSQNTVTYQQDILQKDRIPGVKLDSTASYEKAITSKNAADAKMYTKEESGNFFERKVSAMQYNYYGKITDAQGNALPYTNIMVVGQDFGTYTDAGGNFNFISEDSTLPIRTRSLGYLPQNLTLNAGRQQTKIVLHEDEKLKNNLAVVMPERQLKLKKVQPTIVERDSIEGVEPSIGFLDYNLYLANNNRISELQQMGRQVKLNFDIDKDGNATNITVAQSSGEALDNEAIRLLKEGPKWKSKKGKKGNITVKF
jgi:TonB family protein